MNDFRTQLAQYLISGSTPADPTMTNPVGWSSTTPPQYISNQDPNVSPVASPYLMSDEQRLGAFGRSTPVTGQELKAVEERGRRLFDYGMMVAGASQPIGSRFVRRSQSPSSPFNPGAPEMAMFVETKAPRATLDSLSGYGPAGWISRGSGAVDVRSLQPAFVRALREAGFHKEYGTSAAALARDAAPNNIVNSAGLWDNPSLVKEVYDSVLQPRGITAVRTPDGLVIFDPKHARPIKVPR